jgi:hypothetical protein
MFTNRVTSGGSIAGVSMSGATSRPTTAGVGYNGPLAVATVAAMTYTSASAGSLVCEAGTHGISDGELFDIYWTIGGVNYCGYGAIATTISPDHTDTTFAFTGSVGDAIPASAAGLAVTICKQLTLDIDFDADKMHAYGVVCSGIAHVKFITTSTVNLALYLPLNEFQGWAIEQGIANPLAGHVISSVTVSQASATAVQTLRIGVAYDA